MDASRLIEHAELVERLARHPLVELEEILHVFGDLGRILRLVVLVAERDDIVPEQLAEPVEPEPGPPERIVVERLRLVLE